MKLVHPHHRLIVRLARKFGLDPAFQLRLHLIATGVWAINFVAAVAVFVLFPGFWSRFSVLYLTLVSLYANWATDYGAVPGAIAAVSAQAIRAQQRQTADPAEIGQTTHGDDW